MYRIQQQLVSWVVDRIADVAEINPDDVTPSLMSGKITLSSLKLRVARLNKLLPIRIERGTVEGLSVSIPWLTRSVQPLVIEVKGATIVLSMDQSGAGAQTDMPFEEILLGITDETIIGVTSEQLLSRESTESPLEDTSAPAFGRVAAAARSETLSRRSGQSGSGYSDDDDDGFHSCRSDSDTESSSGSESDDDRSSSAGSDQSSKRPGIFRNMLSKVATAATYVAPAAWTAPRTVRLQLADCFVEIPCDDRRGLRFTAGVEDMTVDIEPTEDGLKNTKIKVVKISIRNALVKAKFQAHEQTIALVPGLDIVVTTTLDATGTIVIAKNTKVTHVGQVNFYLGEQNVDLVTKCVVARNILLKAPSYAYDFLNLRNRRSWWPYATACVQASIRDRKRRWNFNLSHLGVFTAARRRYFELLDRCHKEGSTEPYKQELAVVESELHYRDVVLAVRQIAQEKYRKTTNDAQAEVASPDRPPALSLHLDVEAVRVFFPVESSLLITRIQVIQRTDELSATVQRVRMHREGLSHDFLCGGGTAVTSDILSEGGEHQSRAFLSLVRRIDTARRLITMSVELQPLMGHFMLIHLMESVRPLLAAFVQIDSTKPPAAIAVPVGGKKQPLPQVAPAFGGSLTMSVRNVHLSVDGFLIHLDKLSVAQSNSIDAAANDPTTLAMTCTELSVAHKGVYLLAPIRVTTAEKRVRISSVRITWNEGMHAAAQEIAILAKAEMLLFATEREREVKPHVAVGTASRESSVSSRAPIRPAASLTPRNGSASESTTPTRNLSMSASTLQSSRDSPSLALLANRIKKTVRSAVVFQVESIHVNVEIIHTVLSIDNLQVKQIELLFHENDKKPISGTGIDWKEFSLSASHLSKCDFLMRCAESSIALGPTCSSTLAQVAPIATVVQMKSVLVGCGDRAEETPLCFISSQRIAASAGEVLLDCNHIDVAKGGMLIHPTKLSITPHKGVTPNEWAPYSASKVCIATNITRVHVPGLTKNVDVDALNRLTWDCCVPLAKVLMSETAQRLFQNGLSDIFLNLSVLDQTSSMQPGSVDTPAEIVLDEGKSIFAALHFSQPQRRSSRWSSRSAPDLPATPVLTALKPFLSSTPWAASADNTSSALSVVNECTKLYLAIGLPAVTCHVFLAKPRDHDEIPSVEFVMEGLAVVQPMAILPFWTDPAVVIVQPPSISAGVGRIAFSLCIPRRHVAVVSDSPMIVGGGLPSRPIELNLEKLTYIAGQDQVEDKRSGRHGSSDDESGNERDNLSPTTSSSATDSVGSLPDLHRISLHKLKAGIDIHSLSEMAEVMDFAEEAKRIALPLGSNCLVLSASATEETFAQTAAHARVVVVSAFRVLVFHQCTFVLRTPLEVGPESSVVFRQCHFELVDESPSGAARTADVLQQWILCANSSATFVAEHCTVRNTSPVNSTLPPQQLQPSVALKPDTQVIVALDYFSAGTRVRFVDTEVKLVLQKVVCNSRQREQHRMNTSLTIQELSSVAVCRGISCTLAQHIQFHLQLGVRSLASSRRTVQAKQQATPWHDVARQQCTMVDVFARLSAESIHIPLSIVVSAQHACTAVNDLLLSRQKPSGDNDMLVIRRVHQDAPRVKKVNIDDTFAFTLWKADLAIPTMDVVVCLPNLVPIGTVALTDVTLRSVRPSLESRADFDLRATADLAVWDPLLSLNKKLFVAPLSCSALASFTSVSGLDLTIEVGQLDIALTDDVIRTVNSVSRCMEYWDKNPAFVIANQTGIPISVMLNGQRTPMVIHKVHAEPQLTFSFPFRFKTSTMREYFTIHHFNQIATEVTLAPTDDDRTSIGAAAMSVAELTAPTDSEEDWESKRNKRHTRELHLQDGVAISLEYHVDWTSFTQVLTIRSMFHIRNDTLDTTIRMGGLVGFPSPLPGEEQQAAHASALPPYSISPSELSCVPLPLLDDPHMQVYLVVGEGSSAVCSYPQHLGNASMRALAQRAVSQGASHLGQLVTFTFPSHSNVLPRHIDITFEFDAKRTIVTSTFAPARPSLINHLDFPVEVRFHRNKEGFCSPQRQHIDSGSDPSAHPEPEDEPLHKCFIAPGGIVPTHCFSAAAFSDPMFMELAVDLPSGLYRSSERFLFDPTVMFDEDEVSVVMHHAKKGSAQYFEITLVPIVRPGRSSSISITSCRSFVVVNRSGVECLLSSDQGTSIGTAGDVALRSDAAVVGDDQMTNNSLECSVYVPFETPFLLRTHATTPSEPITVTATDIGTKKMIKCPERMESTAIRTVPCVVQCLFIHHDELLSVGEEAARKQTARFDSFDVTHATRQATLLPAMYWKNEHNRTLYVRHTVMRASTASQPPSQSRAAVTVVSEELYSRTFAIAPGGTAPYATMAMGGYEDWFSFLFPDANEELAPRGSLFPPSVHLALFPLTTEAFVAQCGQTHHTIHVEKETSCDPARITIGPARSPLVMLANLSLHSFEEIPALSSTRFTPLPRCTSIDLHPLGARFKGSAIRIALAHNSSFECSDPFHVHVSTRVEDGSLLVFVSDLPLETVDVTSPGGKLDGAAFATSQFSDERSQCPSLDKQIAPLFAFPVNASLHIRRLSAELTSSNSPFLFSAVDNLHLWLKSDGSLSTVHFSFANLAVLNKLEGSEGNGALPVVLPVSIDITLSDVAVDQAAPKLVVRNFRVNITALELNFTDIFLSALPRFAKRCAPLHVCITKKHGPFRQKSERGMSHSKKFTSAATVPVVTKPWAVTIGHTTIGEINLTFSWSRNSKSPGTDILRNFLLTYFIGSVSNVSLRLPLYNVRDMKHYSEFVDSITRHYLSALLQMPLLIGGYKLLGSPLSWAGDLVSGISSMSQKGISASLSIFGFGAKPEAPALPEPTPQRDRLEVKDCGDCETEEAVGTWLCTRCATVHELIVNGTPPSDILRYFGPATLAHHSSLRERFQCLEVAIETPMELAEALCIEFSNDGRDISEAAAPLLPLERRNPASEVTDEHVAAVFPLYVLVAHAQGGYGIPASNHITWRRIVEIELFKRLS